MIPSRRALLGALVLLPIGVARAAEDDAPFTEAIPAQYSQVREVGLFLEGITATKEERYAVKLRLVNPTKSPISFDGYSAGSPRTLRTEKWTNDRWIITSLRAWCGTGAQTCVILPGRSSLITIYCDGDAFPMRASVSYAVGSKAEPHDHVVQTMNIDRPLAPFVYRKPKVPDLSRSSR